jgi:serine/threonine-protein kinase mTOR
MLLTCLVGATKRLIKPYALPMLRALLRKADDPNITVASNVVLCLGELASAAGEEVMTFVPDLMQVVISRLADPSLPKRDAALATLGKTCASAGYVIDPLIDYPQLVPLLGKILKMEQRSSIRREVIKVFGILGAMDPYRRNVSVIPSGRWPSSNSFTTSASHSMMLKKPRNPLSTLFAPMILPCPQRPTTIIKTWSLPRFSEFFVIILPADTTIPLLRQLCHSSRPKA